MGVKIRGMREMDQKLYNFSRKYPKKVGAGAVAELKVELKEVNKRTPELTGALIKSERVEGPEYVGKKINAYIVAGDEIAWYALIVHEDLEAFHPKGEAKFVESVLRESRSSMANRIAVRCKIGPEDI